MGIRLADMSLMIKDKRDTPVQCEVIGCNIKPAERKPFCIDHLNRLDFVRELEKSEIQRQNDDDLVATPNGWKHIGLDCQRAKDILIQLIIRGATPPKRLAIIIEASVPSTDGYIKALENAGLVAHHVFGSRRGIPRHAIEITPKGRTLVNLELEEAV